MTKRKIKVAVLMGGRTPEHDISVISGTKVVKALNRSKYIIYPIKISKTGRGIEKLLDKKVDVVFIAMHGPFGEDGTVQGMLELLGVPYTGPGVLASALGMDKLLFRELLSSKKLPFPKYIALRRGESLVKVEKVLGKPPYFIKPYNQGSSVGNSLVKTKKELKKAIDLAFEYSDIILVDKYLKGLELTCGVLGNEKPVPLPLVEIIPKNEFFDYESKYTAQETQEIVPARINKRLTQKIQKIATEVYQLLDCRGFSRVDFILKDNKDPYILEINTIPGLTPMSLLPKAAKTYGLSYPQLIDKIISYALE